MRAQLVEADMASIGSAPCRAMAAEDIRAKLSERCLVAANHRDAEAIGCRIAKEAGLTNQQLKALYPDVFVPPPLPPVVHDRYSNGSNGIISDIGRVSGGRTPP